MNDKGKLKHRFHALFYRRGETPEEDVLIAHHVGRIGNGWGDCQRQLRRWMEKHRRAGQLIDYGRLETEEYHRQQKVCRRESFLCRETYR